ncbi:MAG: PTS system mannose/fructose/sorbose family transporter subunit IID, partial [Lachnospiraceae bacterium]
AVTMMTAHANEITHAASVLGVFVIGALIANYGGGTSLAISIPNGESTIVIQDYLNKILPLLLPLLMTLMCYFLIIKKGFTPIKLIVLLLVIGIVGCAFGIWYQAGGYTPLVPVPWDILA